jgi:signal transduction histidine kinase
MIDLLRARRRFILVDVAAGLVVALLAVFPPIEVDEASILTAVLAFLAIGCRNVSPLASLALVWLLAVAQLVLGERPGFADLALVLVLYACARRGTRWELGAGAVSAVVGGLMASSYLTQTGTRYAQMAYGSTEGQIAASLAPLVMLASAWLLGFAVRALRSQRIEAGRRVEAETEMVKALDSAEFERLRATMARDVHDVVGHSLAVIIAQADSTEFIHDEARLRQVSATIAATARRSLLEVRQVLNGDPAAGTDDETIDLDALIEQVRASGVAIERVVRGEPRLHDAGLRLAMRRVAQEMLTNAIRHGDAREPVAFRETWRAHDVVIEVENRVGLTRNPGSGSGVRGMRARIEGMGGMLEAEAVDGIYTARARIPAPAAESAAGSPVTSAAGSAGGSVTGLATGPATGSATGSVAGPVSHE